ncbi:MAG: hypothetical protein IT201_06175 [Thermoleophilia bacterium]|nr:hypothetical protein [Thermoleophilia bacterium]
MIEDWLARLDRGLAEGEVEELATAVCALAFLAGQEVEVSAAERHAAARRALLLLAAGGDPARGLHLDGRPVAALAADLDAPERRSQLLTGLGRLIRRCEGLPHASEIVRALVGDADLAWRAYAAGLLAEELDVDA